MKQNKYEAMTIRHISNLVEIDIQKQVRGKVTCWVDEERNLWTEIIPFNGIVFRNVIGCFCASVFESGISITVYKDSVVSRIVEDFKHCVLQRYFKFF